MLKRYAFLALLPLLSCQGQQPADSPARVEVPVEHVVATKDQQARRAQSEAYCRAHGVPYYKNPTAMLTDSEVEATLRTQDQVVDRALALCFIGLKSEGMKEAQLAEIDKAYHISAKLTPVERAYVTAPQIRCGLQSRSPAHSQRKPLDTSGRSGAQYQSQAAL